MAVSLVSTSTRRAWRAQGLKWCPECRTAKPLTEFKSHATRKDGRNAYCRLCASARQVHANRKIHYGITRAEYETMHVIQDGRCACCGETARLVVDHCHATGRVRALLCQPCNLMIGNAAEDAGTLRAGAEYVQQFCGSV